MNHESIAYEDCSLEERHRMAGGLGTEDVRWPGKAAVTFGKGFNLDVHEATLVCAVAFTRCWSLERTVTFEEALALGELHVHRVSDVNELAALI